MRRADDLMNRLMTFGQDQRWRKSVIRHAAAPPNGWLLDLGAGTGDLASTALLIDPSINIVAADFTFEMMRVGISRQSEDGMGLRAIRWLGTDAAAVPFGDNYFDAVVSGFLLRNVLDLKKCLSEQYRVLKPGGVCVALDTSPPPITLLRPLVEFHLHNVIPTLGRVIAGQSEAYHYLPDSTENFLQPEQLVDNFTAAGFEDVEFERRMFGTIAIHWGRKPVRGEEFA